VLVGVDHRDVREVPMMEVALMVLGVEGSKVRLKFMHASAETVGESFGYVCMCACIHTCLCMRQQKLLVSLLCVHVYMHACLCMHICRYVCVYVDIHVSLCMRHDKAVCGTFDVCACMCAYIHTFMHASGGTQCTHTHTFTHAHIHMCMHMYMPSLTLVHS
jgi:hypothetical protein